MEVSVRKLKDHLSEYLRRAQNGEAITVTDHGRPVATLAALTVTSAAARLDRLVASGELSAPSGAPFSRVKRLKVRGRPVSRSLLDDRE